MSVFTNTTGCTFRDLYHAHSKIGAQSIILAGKVATPPTVCIMHVPHGRLHRSLCSYDSKCGECMRIPSSRKAMSTLGGNLAHESNAAPTRVCASTTSAATAHAAHMHGRMRACAPRNQMTRLVPVCMACTCCVAHARKLWRVATMFKCGAATAPGLGPNHLAHAHPGMARGFRAHRHARTHTRHTCVHAIMYMGTPGAQHTDKLAVYQG